ncbi:hypothetical protein TIFTF001_001612 [Ficus carica]|uniref:Uncharacterized protein n=1 Tax=Ficus carica TaxID=3494 RepID=A0AA87Z836_FICCA|nr:hypothetical protein TIFTF001_001612 [Ficus carica]
MGTQTDHRRPRPPRSLRISRPAKTQALEGDGEDNRHPSDGENPAATSRDGADNTSTRRCDLLWLLTMEETVRLLMNFTTQDAALAIHGDPGQGRSETWVSTHTKVGFDPLIRWVSMAGQLAGVPSAGGGSSRCDQPPQATNSQRPPP